MHVEGIRLQPVVLAIGRFEHCIELRVVGREVGVVQDLTPVERL